MFHNKIVHILRYRFNMHLCIKCIDIKNTDGAGLLDKNLILGHHNDLYDSVKNVFWE